MILVILLSSVSDPHGVGHSEISYLKFLGLVTFVNSPHLHRNDTIIQFYSYTVKHESYLTIQTITKLLFRSILGPKIFGKRMFGRAGLAEEVPPPSIE